jgi:ubiquinone/menaquinone biosynthesis C-methylase UbiE
MYDSEKAGHFWSKRVESVDHLSAVLSYNLPKYVNQAYSNWELGLILNTLPDVKNKRILDLACGVGRVLVPLAKKGAHVFGIDNSNKMLKISADNVKSAGVEENVQLKKSDAANLPFVDNSFDVVICVGLLEHLPELIRYKVLSEISRVIKRRGILLLTITNVNKNVFLKQVKRYGMEKQREDGYFCAAMDQKKIEKYLEEKGFGSKVIGSNCFYSLAEHLFKPFYKIFSKNIVMASFFNLCAKSDIVFKNKGYLDSYFANIFLIKFIKNSEDYLNANA